MKIKILVLVSTILFSGCVQDTISLDPKKQENLTGKTITFVHQNTPTYPEVMSPSKALGMGLIGGVLGAVIVSAISKVGVEEKVPPSTYISKKIIPNFVKNYKMKFLKNEFKEESNVTDMTSMNNEQEEVPEMDKFLKNYKTDYILDIHSMWSVGYFEWHWGSYAVRMQNDLRLIDRINKKVIAQVTCQYLPKYKEGLPSYDEMFANEEKLMKEESFKAMNLCVEQIKKDIFK